MELAGKVIAVLEPKGGISKTSGNSWKTQEYVIETHEQYPRRMCFNLFGEEKINQFNIQLGEEINVSFDINAREYQGRWYNDIRAWKVDRVSPDQMAVPGAAPMPAAAPLPGAAPMPTAAPAQYQQPAPAQPAVQQMPVFNPEADSTDDLPF